MQETISDLLRLANRDGIENLLAFLNDESDFFTAPASTKHHLAYKGGLAKHSYNVFKCAKSLAERYDFTSKIDSVIITALTHDFCKIDYYKEVHENPTDPQMRYLSSLMSKAKIPVPKVLSKVYAGTLIDFMLNVYSAGMTLPEFTPSYVVKDNLPLGHGEKSLYVVTQFINLLTEEALAIRWHMGFSEIGVTHFPLKYSYQDAVKMSKLVTILQLADLEAAQLVEE